MLHGGDDLQKRLAALGSPEKRRQAFGRLGLLAVAEANRLVPRRTGNLARTIRVEAASESAVRVTAGGFLQVGYAADVEWGTKPHDIVPRNKKALRWATRANSRLSGSPRSGAPVMFAKRVHHPGTKPHPYLIPGAFKALQIAGMDQLVLRTWNEAA